MAGLIIARSEFTKPRPMAESGWLEKHLKTNGLDVATCARQEWPNGDWEYAKDAADLTKLPDA